jgi:hypothetical protein
MRSRLDTRWLAAALAVLAAVLVVGLLLQVRTARTVNERLGAQLDQLAKVSRTNDATFARMLDCTEPTGKCYQQGQRRTGEAIGSINDAAILAAVCAHQHADVADVRACVAEGLETR